jgi:hypothetical protein
VPTSIVTPSWLITVVLRLWDRAPSCSACVERGLERSDVDLGDVMASRGLRARLE